MHPGNQRTEIRDQTLVDRVIHARREIKDWDRYPAKSSEIHIDVSHSRQPLVKAERLVRYEMNTVMLHVWCVSHTTSQITQLGYLYNSEIQMKTCLGRPRARCSPRRARTGQTRVPARTHGDARGCPNYRPPRRRLSILPGAHVGRCEIRFWKQPTT
jgi:hypothetical protein